MSVADEIRRVKMRKSAELKARETRAAKREAKRLEGRLQSNRAPGAMFDTGFKAQLDRKAREAKERAGDQPRPDLDQAIAVARQKGHLPPAHDAGTSYVPTVEEILGDEVLPKPPAPTEGDTENLPSADDVLNTPRSDENAAHEAAGYKPGKFTAEELAEIDRMNPRRENVAPKKQIVHHSRDRNRRR